MLWVFENYLLSWDKYLKMLKIKILVEKIIDPAVLHNLKGWLISEWNFGVFKSSIKPTKFFLTVGQNNFGNKIPFLYFFAHDCISFFMADSPTVKGVPPQRITGQNLKKNPMALFIYNISEIWFNMPIKVFYWSKT